MCSSGYAYNVSRPPPDQPGLNAFVGLVLWNLLLRVDRKGPKGLRRELGQCLLALSCWKPPLQRTRTGSGEQGDAAGNWAETGPDAHLLPHPDPIPPHPQDWWNSTSFSNYYRTWNVVVHDWLYSYVYQDGLWVRAQLSRLTEPLWDTLCFPFSAHSIFSKPKGPFDFHLPHSTQPSGQKESPSYDLTSFLSCLQLHLLQRVCLLSSAF